MESMDKRIETSYRSLLRKLAQDGLLTEPEGALLGRLFEHGEHQALGLMTHEAVRRLVREGWLALRRGNLARPGEGLTVVDERRGCLYTLPDLITSEHPVLRLPLNPLLGPAPSFTDDEVAGLFQDQSRRFLSSVERSADMKGTVTGMLDLLQQVIGPPVVLCYTQALPVPGVIARGLRRLRDRLARPADPREAPPARPPQAPVAFVRAWKNLVEAAGRDATAMLSVPDLCLLVPEERPLERGSALLVPLAERQPAWSAVLVAASPEPYAFAAEHLARVRLFAPHFRRQLTHAVLLQTVISHDFLTKIYNRSFFEDQFARTLASAARRQQSFALLIADIDDFRAFNSRHGYDAGDQVLRSVAESCKGVLRTTDVLARYGGEEFVVLLAPPVSRAEAVQVAERLRAAVERLRVEVPTLEPEGLGARVQVPVTVSVGGAVFAEDGHSRDALWSSANAMLLAAKREGKNRVRFRGGIIEVPRPETGTNGV
jgi:diguanylate cyclase (GGDEF)-like protein